MANMTVEQISNDLFRECYGYKEEPYADISISIIEEFYLGFAKYAYELSINENTIRQIDSSANGSRVEDTISIYFEFNEYEFSVNVITEFSTYLKVKNKIYLNPDLYKSISLIPCVDKDSGLKYTIIPGIEFLNSKDAKDRILLVYEEHVLQFLEKFNISQFDSNLLLEVYEVVSFGIFGCGTSYISSQYRKNVTGKDVSIIDLFPRSISIDPLSIKRKDFAIRVYGRDNIISDTTSWYAKTGFTVSYPESTYIANVRTPFGEGTIDLQRYILTIFIELKSIVNNNRKRSSYMSNIFNSMKKHIAVTNVKKDDVVMLEESIYEGHLSNILKSAFSCNVVDGYIKSDISFTDIDSMSSSIDTFINEGIYSEMYSNISKDLRYLILVLRKGKDLLSTPAAIIYILNKDSSVKYTFIVHLKTNAYTPLVGNVLTLYGDKESSYSYTNSQMKDVTIYKGKKDIRYMFSKVLGITDSKIISQYYIGTDDTTSSRKQQCVVVQVVDMYKQRRYAVIGIKPSPSDRYGVANLF